MQTKNTQRLRMMRKQTSVRSLLTLKHVVGRAAYVFLCIESKKMMAWILFVSPKVFCFSSTTIIIPLETTEGTIICQLLLDSGRTANWRMEFNKKKRKISEFFNVADGPGAIEAQPSPKKTFYQKRLEERIQRLSAAESNGVACPDVEICAVESICRDCVEKDNTVRFNNFYIKMNVHYLI